MTEEDRSFQRVLVANRGEIAVRVIRACHELGLATVAVYGPGEEQAVHVRSADDAYRIPSEDPIPYLDGPALIEAARLAGATAVHPGYGFLAENAAFAAACEAAGLIFVGPSPAAIQAMGDKVEARQIAAAAGVPIVPGTEGPAGAVTDAAAWANAHGYPVAVKAAGGGGGRGFRVARTPDELADAFTGAAAEAERYFNNPVVYLERYLEEPRHVEVQVFADNYGHVVSLGERDCSVQRRHQKLIEESPSPAVTSPLRQALGEAAVALAKAVDYRGAGTVEFLLAPDGSFYFLEMNTRIQVEHTITEMVTGIDLVKEQLRVAGGQPLSFTAETVVACGHAIECRINAEDAGRDFAPGPGMITAYHEPAGFGVRVDSAMEPGSVILPTYDSLIAKLIVWGRDREEALARMRRALTDFTVEGVPTTIPFHLAVLANPVFAAGKATTSFLPAHPEVLPPPATPSSDQGGEAQLESTVEELLVEVNGRRLMVRVHGGDQLAASAPVATSARSAVPRPVSGRKAARAGSGNDLTSPIQGTVIRVAVEPGQTVAAGDLICVVEAMKMENELVAHRPGVITSLNVAKGDSVKIGAVIATITDPT